MGNIAFIFSGQGAQYTGMGKSLAEVSSAAAEIFQAADSVRSGTSTQCFEASSEELMKTDNTQPCIYTVDLAAACALREAGIEASAVAGYSLGEVAALAYAGAFTPAEGMKLVTARGKAMQKASEAHETGMMAVLKLDDETIEQLASAYTNVYPVNFNCKGQVTVAGDKAQLDSFKDDVKAAKGLVRVLEVAGGFHSPYMASAAEELAPVLADADIDQADIPVYSNYTAKPYEGDYRDLLLKQICNPIRWQTAIENMIANGIDTFVEVGPGTRLSKMLTRISKEITVLNVEDADSLKATIEAIKNK